jgi:hypothetical protein
MTGSSGHPIDTVVATSPAPRLSLKPMKSTSGYVDGAWWSGSLDPPTAESRAAVETLRRAGSSDSQETIHDLLCHGPDSDRPEPDRQTALAGIG